MVWRTKKFLALIAYAIFCLFLFANAYADNGRSLFLIIRSTEEGMLKARDIVGREDDTVNIRELLKEVDPNLHAGIIDVDDLSLLEKKLEEKVTREDTIMGAFFWVMEIEDIIFFLKTSL